MSKRLLCIAITAIAILASGHARAAGSEGCQARLEAVSAQWSASGLSTPAKPSQARVTGANGLVLSGAEVTNLQNQIRWAAVACRQGDDQAARQRLDTVAAALDRRQ
jgi:hypothetical protein